MEHDREAPLIYLWVRDAGVGHVGVDATAPVPRGTSPSASGNGLIVAQLGIAKGEVVHASLHPIFSKVTLKHVEALASTV